MGYYFLDTQYIQYWANTTNTNTNGENFTWLFGESYKGEFWIRVDIDRIRPTINSGAKERLDPDPDKKIWFYKISGSETLNYLLF